MVKTEIHQWGGGDNNSQNSSSHTSCSEEPVVMDQKKKHNYNNNNKPKKKVGGVRFAADVPDETKIKPLQRAPSGFAFESEASIDPLNFGRSNSGLPAVDKLNTARAPRRGIASSLESNSSWTLDSRNMLSMDSMGSMSKWDCNEMNAALTESTLLGSLEEPFLSSEMDSAPRLLQSRQLPALHDPDLSTSSLVREEHNLFEEGIVRANDVDSDLDDDDDDDLPNRTASEARSILRTQHAAAAAGAEIQDDSVPCNDELQIHTSGSNESIEPPSDAAADATSETNQRRKEQDDDDDNDDTISQSTLKLAALTLRHPQDNSCSSSMHIFDSASLADE